jgi:hypothetical protein
MAWTKEQHIATRGRALARSFTEIHWALGKLFEKRNGMNARPFNRRELAKLEQLNVRLLHKSLALEALLLDKLLEKELEP